MFEVLFFLCKVYLLNFEGKYSSLNIAPSVFVSQRVEWCSCHSDRFGLWHRVAANLCHHQQCAMQLVYSLRHTGPLQDGKQPRRQLPSHAASQSQRSRPV